MKKFKIIIFILIVSCGLFLLIGDWEFFKGIPYEIYDKIAKSDFERSLEYKNIKLANEPKNPWSYESRGNTFKRYKKYDNALKDYYKALELDKKFSYFVFRDISNVYLAIGNTEKAYEYIHKLLKIAPYPENYLFDLAIIYDYEGKSIDAIETYSKFIDKTNKKEFKNEQLYALKRRAVHYILLKEYDKAKEDVETLLKESPDDKEAVKLKELLSDTSNLSSLNIRKVFKLDVHEAIVGTMEI